MQKRYDHGSAERVISGLGLVDLYHALYDVQDGHGREITKPAEVLARASEVPLSTANQAVDMFCSFLGGVAGDLALTLGALGGVFTVAAVSCHAWGSDLMRRRFAPVLKTKDASSPICRSSRPG